MKQSCILLSLAIIFCAIDVQAQPQLVSSDSVLALTFLQGSLKFMNGDYKSSIALYENVMKRDTLIKKPYWYVLIDNLGMAYGISGQFASADKIFRYGVTKDPKYPLFYYNLACNFAEQDNLDSTLVNLRIAFTYKANTIPGETLPPPEQDNSFQRYLDNDRFRKLMEDINTK